MKRPIYAFFKVYTAYFILDYISCYFFRMNLNFLNLLLHFSVVHPDLLFSSVQPDDGY
jgi:hypothetical protein